MATALQRDRAAATITPRLLSRLQDAVYVGLSATEFDLWTKLHRITPIRHGRRVLFDRRQLDLVIDRLIEAVDSEQSNHNDPYSPTNQVA